MRSRAIGYIIGIGCAGAVLLVVLYLETLDRGLEMVDFSHVQEEVESSFDVSVLSVLPHRTDGEQEEGDPEFVPGEEDSFWLVIRYETPLREKKELERQAREILNYLKRRHDSSDDSVVGYRIRAVRQGEDSPVVSDEIRLGGP